MSGQFKMFYRPEEHGSMTVDEVVEDIATQVIERRELDIPGEIEMLRWGLRQEVERERAKKEESRPGPAEKA